MNRRGFRVFIIPRSGAARFPGGAPDISVSCVNPDRILRYVMAEMDQQHMRSKYIPEVMHMYEINKALLEKIDAL